MATICEKNFAIHVGGGLHAFWNLDESVGGDGGPRVDKVSGIVLTPGGNTTWSGGGKILRGLWLPIGGCNLTGQPTEPLLNYLGTGITIFGWIRITLDDGLNAAPLGLYRFIDSGGTIIGFLDSSYHYGVNEFHCLLSGFGGPISLVLSQDITDSAFHFVVIWYDPSDKKIHIQIDNGPVTDSAGALASDIPAYPNGRFEFIKVGNNDVILDEWGIFSEVLSAARRTSLFNSNNGVTWPAVNSI